MGGLYHAQLPANKFTSATGIKFHTDYPTMSLDMVSPVWSVFCLHSWLHFLGNAHKPVHQVPNTGHGETHQCAALTTETPLTCILSFCLRAGKKILLMLFSPLMLVWNWWWRCRNLYIGTSHLQQENILMQIILWEVELLWGYDKSHLGKAMCWEQIDLRVIVTHTLMWFNHAEMVVELQQTRWYLKVYHFWL